MKTIRFQTVRFLALAAIASTLTACQPFVGELSLEGCWIRDDQKTKECWSQNGNEWTGAGYAFGGHGDTTKFEDLKIISTDSGRVYVAEVANNEEPAYFVETEEWVFENPNYPMPNKVTYDFVSDKEMVVILSGNDGDAVWRFFRED